jgi:lysophospholipase L1-like esterase
LTPEDNRSRARRFVSYFVIVAPGCGHVQLVKAVCVVLACCALPITLSLAACTEAGDSNGALAGSGGSSVIGPATASGAGVGGGAGPGAAGAAGSSITAGAGGPGGSGGMWSGAAGTAGTANTGGSSGSAAAGTGAAGAGGTGGATAGSGGGSGSGGAQAYAPCPGNGEPCKILPLGDSITFGLGYSGGYRVELFSKALAADQEITFVGSVMNGPSMVDGVSFPRNNEGHSGWKIDQLLSLIPAPALSDEPHIILLMIGTNDVAQNDDLSNAPERLDGLLGELIAEVPDALIVVAQITPLSFGGSGVMAYNAALPAIVEARAEAGEHVMLVDMNTDFPTSLLGDGVHPNQMGYERMAEVWYDAIGGLLD